MIWLRCLPPSWPKVLATVLQGPCSSGRHRPGLLASDLRRTQAAVIRPDDDECAWWKPETRRTPRSGCFMCRLARQSVMPMGLMMPDFHVTYDYLPEPSEIGA